MRYAIRANVLGHDGLTAIPFDRQTIKGKPDFYTLYTIATVNTDDHTHTVEMPWADFDTYEQAETFAKRTF